MCAIFPKLTGWKKKRNATSSAKSISDGKIIPESFLSFFIQPCDCAGGRLYIWCLRKTRWHEIGSFPQKQRREERCSSGNLSNLRRLLEAFVSDQEEELSAQKSHIYIPIFYTETHIARLIKDSVSCGKQGRTEGWSQGTAMQQNSSSWTKRTRVSTPRRHRGGNVIVLYHWW